MSIDPAEHALTGRLRRGDPTAVAALLAAYGPRIEQLAFRHLRNREDAEEVVQDVIMRVVRAIGAFRGDAAFASWIYRITFNASMSHLRRTRASRRHETSLDAHGTASPAGLHAERQAREFADWSSMADEAYLSRQLRARLDDLLRALPASSRASVELRDLQGLSTAEASRALGVTIQTVKSRLHRGRAILRPKLAEFWEGLSLHRRAPSAGRPGSASAAWTGA
jgi:RNA polymerase sigma-70 factor (ECF subfamily)